MGGSKKSGKTKATSAVSESGMSNGGRSGRSSGKNDGGGGAESSTAGGHRRLLIKPLSTVGDRGKPTKSLSKDLQRVVNLIEDERHLVAYDLYMDCKERIEKLREQKRKHDEEMAAGAKKKTSSWMQQHKTKKDDEFDGEEFDLAIELARKHKEDFIVLERQAPIFQSCLYNMDDSDGWTLAQTLFGVTTFYRRENDGSLSIKLEGELKGTPLFEQVAVLREIDLHCHWAPFVTSSLTLGHLDKLDVVGWIMIGLPNFGLARDSCFRAIGCDCVEEDQSVLIVGRGVDDRPPDAIVDEDTKFLSEDPEVLGLDIPPAPTRMGSGRLTMKMFEAKIQVLAPDHCHTYILANLDPNLAFIPQSLLEFVMKKMCGFLLNKLQSAANKVAKDPVRNVHAQRMRDESAFYRDWLLPKFQNVAALRGWDMPPLVAFELSEAQQVEAEKLVQRRIGQMHSFSYFDSEASNDGLGSNRSVPNLYRSKPLDENDKDDDDSDISSLSGTSQSIWKNNPIANYLREVEQKTQAVKDKAAQEARRKAAARLRPRPLPVDKKERLKELKEHKDKKMRARAYASQGSMDGVDSLPPVDENDANTVATGVTSRSVPYSPISAALKGHGRWPRLWVVSGLVLLLFLLLHGDRFLPTFSSVDGEVLPAVLRDSVTIFYLFICGVVHFFLCDVELIYAFEAFELGMKSGEQVKTFYRGQMRLVVAVLSGLLVVTSVAKALMLAWLKAALVWLCVLFQQVMSKNFFSQDNDNPQLEEDEVVAQVDVMGINATMISKVPSVLYSGYSMIMSFSCAVFDFQMRMFVRSNIVGRSIEGVTTGIYNAWMGVLFGIGNSIYSLAHSDDIQDNPGYSWRDDAISSARTLLTYTAVFLLVVLAFLNLLSKSYRYKKPSSEPPDYASIAATTNSGSEQTSLSPLSSRKITKRKTPLQSKSMDAAGAKRRLKFVRKKNSKMDDDDSI